MAATKLEVRSIGHVSGRDDESLPSIHLSVEFRVEQSYQSSDGSFKSNTRRDLISQISLQFPSESLTSDIISRMISQMNIPFPLERLQYRECHDHKTLHDLENLDDLITIVVEDARWTVAKFSNCGRKLLRLDINIENRVILTSHEIEAMDRAKKMEQRVLQLNQYVSWLVRVRPGMDFRGIEKEIALRVRNTAPDKGSLEERYERELRMSLVEQAMREYLGEDRSVPATRSSIEGLETVRFEGNDREEEVCAICKDDMFIGSQVTRMPCSHSYHQLCIFEWLKRSHMCPLCRFKLPII